MKTWNNGDRPNATDVNRWEAAASGQISGLKADGVTDCTALVQAQIDSLGSAGGLVRLPPGNVRITTPLQINTNGVIIQGDGLYRSRIFADGCNGIEVAAGVSDLHLLGVELVQKVPYTTTANTLYGVKINGSSASHAQNFVFRDVLCNGFMAGFYCRYLWASVLDNIRTVNGLIGLVAYGLSVNNMISNSTISVAGAGTVAGSRCVALLGYEDETLTTPVASEGWIIDGTCVLDGGEIDVEIAGVTHCDISGILDHAGTHGVLIRDNGTNFGGNSDIHPSYIGMSGTAGVAAVQNANTIPNSQLVKTRVHDIHAVAYVGAACTYGVSQSGAQGLMIIRGNTLRAFTNADIDCRSTGNIVENNDCKSAITNNISGAAAALTLAANNTGHVLVNGAGPGTPFSYVMQGNNKVANYVAAPTVGTWAVGDRIYNSVPAVGQPQGWICIAAGTPGTWVAMANL